MKCPHCLTDRLGLSSSFTYEECGYEGEGLVEFYECDNCGTTVEVCIPDKQVSCVDIRQKENDK